ncbi:hypothetical protein At12D1_41380 [Agrobacterium tumefaciens]|nr:hypothetical protein At12D1_41380 [Agrobacterium tumefaciens]
MDATLGSVSNKIFLNGVSRRSARVLFDILPQRSDRSRSARAAVTARARTCLSTAVYANHKPGYMELRMKRRFGVSAGRAFME